MIVARRKKETTDIIRIIADFSKWLDPDEQIESATTPVITIFQQGCPEVAFAPPPDPTPLTLISSVMVSSNTQLYMLFTSGSPGLEYVATTVVQGGTSGRSITIEAHIRVKDTTIPVTPGSPLADAISVDAAAAINSAAQLATALAAFRNGSLTITGLVTSPPTPGSGIVWNNGGVLCVA